MRKPAPPSPEAHMAFLTLVRWFLAVSVVPGGSVPSPPYVRIFKNFPNQP